MYVFIYDMKINKYILVFIYILLHGRLSATTGFMPSLDNNHQAEKYFGEIEKIEKIQ